MKITYKVLILIVIQILVSSFIVNYRSENFGLKPGKWLSEYPISSTGPLKGMLMGLWWIEIQKHQFNFEYKKIQILTNRISFLNPYSPEIWEYLAWNLSVNISADMRYVEDQQYEWFIKGMDHLDKGLYYNENSPMLLFAQGYNVYFQLKKTPSLNGKIKKYLGQDPKHYTLLKLEEAIKYGKLAYIQECFRAQVNYELGNIDRSAEIFQELIIKYPTRKSHILGMMQELRSNE
jgi:hypothetical protein